MRRPIFWIALIIWMIKNCVLMIYIYHGADWMTGAQDQEATVWLNITNDLFGWTLRSVSYSFVQNPMTLEFENSLYHWNITWKIKWLCFVFTDKMFNRQRKLRKPYNRIAYWLLKAVQIIMFVSLKGKELFAS